MATQPSHDYRVKQAEREYPNSRNNKAAPTRCQIPLKLQANKQKCVKNDSTALHNMKENNNFVVNYPK